MVKFVGLEQANSRRFKMRTMSELFQTMLLNDMRKRYFILDSEFFPNCILIRFLDCDDLSEQYISYLEIAYGLQVKYGSGHWVSISK